VDDIRVYVKGSGFKIGVRSIGEYCGIGNSACVLSASSDKTKSTLQISGVSSNAEAFDCFGIGKSWGTGGDRSRNNGTRGCILASVSSRSGT
jgi:hypothetical protein